MKCVLAITGLAAARRLQPNGLLRQTREDDLVWPTRHANGKKTSAERPRKEKSLRSRNRQQHRLPQQSVPPTGAAPSAAPNANSSTPSNLTQPQPTYPEGER